ncbi:ABC transporter [Salinisphaera sp. PC39]|uniref:ABC transporter permease n=1 Tax=Salinisphaera sp. PC39 TaxID=1304156 RepID=UPI00333F3B0E
MRGTAGNILHLGIKELRSLARDPVMLVLLLYSMSVAIYIAATAMPETLNQAPIAIVDDDRSPLSARIADAFYPPYFKSPDLIDRSGMDRRMDRGRDTFALVIPPEFQRDVLAGARPTVQLNVDATRISQAFTGAGYIQSIVADETRAFIERHHGSVEPPVGLNLRARFNPTLEHAWFGAMTELIDNITLLAIVLTGAALIREREHGTVEHLLVMPLTPFQIMVSKVAAMALVVLTAGAASLLLVAHGLLSVPIQGSITLFLAGAGLHLFAATSMGIFLATMARSMPQFGLLIILVLLPLQMLSGGVTPRESMPEMIRTLMLAAPTTHFVSLSQAVLYRGAGPGTVWPQLLALAAIGGTLFTVSLARFRRTIGSMA